MRLRSRWGVAGRTTRRGSRWRARGSRALCSSLRAAAAASLAARSRLARLRVAQRVVPVGFEGVGHEPVVGVDGQVAATGQLGAMAGPLDVAAPQSVGFVGACFELGLHGEGDLERERGDGVEQQLADGGVDAGAGDGQAERVPPSGSLRRCTGSRGPRRRGGW